MGGGGKEDCLDVQHADEAADRIHDKKLEPNAVADDIEKHTFSVDQNWPTSPRGRPRMPPKRMSRRESRRFNRSDSEQSLTFHEDEDESESGNSYCSHRRGLPPKTLSRGGSKRLFRSDSDLSIESLCSATTAPASDPLLGSTASIESNWRSSSELFDGHCSIKHSFTLEGLMEEEEDEKNGLDTDDESFDDVLSDSLGGMKSRRRRRTLSKQEAQDISIAVSLVSS